MASLFANQVTAQQGSDPQYAFGGVEAKNRSPFRTAQSTVNTGAAAVELKAGTASKKMWITSVTFVNKTAGEYPVIELVQDAGGTPVIYDTLVGEAEVATSLSEVTHTYDPPIEIAAGLDLDFQLQSATGDVYGHASGWVED